jgi:transketolase
MTEPASTDDIQSVTEKAMRLRTLVLEMTTLAGSGHPGPSLSAADVISVLYFHLMRHRPEEPGWPERDRFILSKGHAAPALYAALTLSGYFPASELRTLRRIGSRLPGFPDMARTPGVEASSGSLGQGLSFGIGAALAARVRDRDYHTFVMVGDGECNEGQIWEAAINASTWDLDTLTVIVDRNDHQREVAGSLPYGPMEPMAKKWEAFGWDTREVDGHDLPALLAELTDARDSRSGRPKAIIARTVRGKGTRHVADNPEYHMNPLPPELLDEAIAELNPAGERYLERA